MSRRHVLVLLAAAAVLATFFVEWRFQRSPAEVSPHLVLVPRDYAPAVGSPAATRLNHPDATAADDLRVLNEVALQFTTTFRPAQLPPIGDNADLVAALTGRNRQRLVFLPPDHPALAGVSSRDRWGTPYHVHPVSAGAFTFRSAGPDRVLFTADDVVSR